MRSPALSVQPSSPIAKLVEKDEKDAEKSFLEKAKVCIKIFQET